MKRTTGIEGRLRALEARATSGPDHEAARTFSKNLLAFIESVFPADPRGCRLDDVARLCGLPNSRHIKPVIGAKFSEDAIQAAAVDAYGEDWRQSMKATMDRALDQIAEVLGDDGIEKLPGTFPPVLTASRLACGVKG